MRAGSNSRNVDGKRSDEFVYAWLYLRGWLNFTAIHGLLCPSHVLTQHATSNEEHTEGIARTHNTGAYGDEAEETHDRSQSFAPIANRVNTHR